MRKRYRRGEVFGAVFILSVCIALFSLTQISRSTDGSLWKSVAAVQLEKQTDLSVDTFNASQIIPCEDQDFSWRSWAGRVVTTKYSRCAVEMQGAYFEDGSSVPGRIRSVVHEKALGIGFPALSNVRVYPVPGTTTMVVGSWAYQNYGNQPSGLHIIRDYQATLTDSIYDSAGNETVRPAKPFDFELKDTTGKLVPIRQNGIKFSANGEWMLFRLVHGGKSAWARLNLDTYETLAFGTPTQDFYAVQNAISNDGRYAIFYEPQYDLRIYDLESCGAGPDTLVSQQCSYIGLLPKVKELLGASEVQLRNFVFRGNQTISVYVSSKKVGESTWKYGEYVLSYGEEATSNGYLAMGDSFSSGEGAYSYRPETNFYENEGKYNLCHQSRSSYPYILNKVLDFDWFGSVACSGAVRGDVVYTGLKERYQDDSPQAKGLKDGSYDDVILADVLPGYRDQRVFLYGAVDTPQVSTISVGGNDIGFGDIVAACVHPLKPFTACYSERNDRERLANLIDEQIKPLSKLLRDMKAQNGRPDFRLYVLGYPKLVRVDGTCGLNVGMNEHERKFADNLVVYLNRAIELAAQNAGVRYVDVSEALVDVAESKDYRLCGDQKILGVNGLILRGDTAKKPGHINYQESYHPNALGHALLAREVVSKSSGLTTTMSTQPSAAYTKVDSALRVALVGDADQAVDRPNYNYDFSESDTSVTRGDMLNFSAKKLHDAKPGKAATLELHSTPTRIGEAVVAGDGTITTSALIPVDVTPGYHEVHVLYQDFFGQRVDQYWTIFVKASERDYDGDGILNDVDPCIVGDQSYVDSDEDGIDDVCDGEYVRSPLVTGQGSDISYDEVVASVADSVQPIAAPVPVRSQSRLDSTDVSNSEVLSSTVTPQIAGTTGVITPSSHAQVADKQPIYSGAFITLGIIGFLVLSAFTVLVIRRAG